MAGYPLRSLAELSERARKNFTQAVEGAIASVWPNTFTVFAKVLALLDFEHEQRRAWLFRQIFASTADALWLRRHGFELGLAPISGQPALGAVTVAATPGLVVPAGLQFVREDGLSYTTMTGARATAASVTLYLEADTAGSLGNLEPGAALALAPDAAAPEGLGSVATVVAQSDGSGLSAGTDGEPIEAFRARVLARKRRPPQGGSAHDYETWAREALPAIRDVFVDSFVNDQRVIWLAFTVTDQPGFIPTLTQIARVQAYIDDPIRRPVTARAEVVRLVPVPVPIVIGGLSPDTPDIRASVAAEIAAVFIDRAVPGRPTLGGSVLSLSWLGEAVSRATGEDRHRLVAPLADLTFPAGRYPVLGPISYVA